LDKTLQEEHESGRDKFLSTQAFLIFRELNAKLTYGKKQDKTSIDNLRNENYIELLLFYEYSHD
jgi:hypothetical protein